MTPMISGSVGNPKRRINSPNRRKKSMKTKFIFITGGVLSSLGKGLTAASIGALLKARGLKVTMQKMDPYINVDPGNMDPLQHGEVFVTDDGATTDLDLGHYERYLGQPLSQANSSTSGAIYYHVINKERRGDYHGGTVQVDSLPSGARIQLNFRRDDQRIRLLAAPPAEPAEAAP